MSFIISESFHHLKTPLGICAHLEKILRFHSTKSNLETTTPLTTHKDPPHKLPHSNSAHKINLYSRNTNILHQHVEEKGKKTEWPATFLVFDLETTGTSKEKNRIIEVALRDLSGGVKSTFQSLVNPETDIYNSHIHNITTSMVNRPGIPKFQELVPVLLDFVQSRQVAGKPVVLIAHNGKKFDFPFLKIQMQKFGFEIPDSWLFLDSLILAGKCTQIPGLKNLPALKEYFKIESVGPAHRAMADVNTLCYVFKELTVHLELTPSDLIAECITAAQIGVREKIKAANKKKKVKGASIEELEFCLIEEEEASLPSD